MARPTKLTPELSLAFRQCLEDGNHRGTACGAVGLAESTLYRWLARGEQEQEGIYHDFRIGVEKAEALAEVRAVGTLQDAALEDWRAALAYLERRFPARWRTQQRMELTGADGGPIRSAHGLDLSKLSDAELELLERLRARAAS